MADLGHPLFPARQIPDSLEGQEVARYLRLVYDDIALGFGRQQQDILNDPRFSDGRMALSIDTMQGPVYIQTVQPKPGQVLYATSEKTLAFGDAATPAPTGGGTAPALGSYNALLDGVYHTDTLAGAVVLGDLIGGNATPKWARIAGNITATRKFLRQVGTGAISAVPAWDTLVAGDIPALSAAAGWTDDGTVVRLTTSTDQVGIGTASPGASFSVVNVNNVADIVALLKAKASQSGDMLEINNSNARNMVKVGATGAITLGNTTDTSVVASIIFAHNTSFVGPIHTIISWGENNNNLSVPTCTADQIGCAGARFYPYKDSTGLFDTGYGQSLTAAWVLVSGETIDYEFWTGGDPTTITPFLRCSWAGNGDLTNYGFIKSRKSLGASAKGVPGILLEETGAGTDFIKVQAPAVVASGSRLQTLLDLNGTIPIVGDDPPAVASRALGKVDLTGQTADIASTNLTNSAPAGFYLIEAILEDTTADVTAGIVTATFAWTDDTGATTDATLTQTLATAGRFRVTIPLYLASGAISYSTAHTGIFGTGQYAIRIRIVALG